MRHISRSCLCLWRWAAMLDYRDCIIADDPSIRAKAHMARLEKSGSLPPDSGQALTLCDVCAKAAGGMGGCSWSRKCEQRPVPGWEAVRRDIQSGVYNELMAESYVVLRCPAFIADKHRQAEFRQFDPERARRRALRNGGRME